jgi:hypothetical protein
MWKIILIIIAAIIYNWQNTEPVFIDSNVTDVFPIKYHSNLSIDKIPIQKNINNSKKYFQFDAYQITPMAEFQLKAKVLAAKHYSHDREAELAPVDLALGWGPMSKQKNLDELTISQSGRWYRWRTDDFPIPRKDIETNSANMHFIPGNDTIKKKLKSIKEGDTVKLMGYLVHINGNDGWRWTSSMTRNDTGDHSCEVILLEDITTI